MKVEKIKNEFEVEVDGKKVKRTGYNFRLVLDNGNRIPIRHVFKGGYEQLKTIADLVED